MTLELTIPDNLELKPRIAVIGVGGAGGNAVNNMIRAGLEGIEFIVANTDAQALAHNLAGIKIQLGTRQTRGLGAGSKPEVGRAAAEESLDEIRNHLNDCHMVFITAGMGGGTGTGAAPVIASLARELGILTVGVVTKPFQFEGSRRMKSADGGIEELQHNVDTLIIIPNQNLFRIATEKTTFADAFAMADEVLHSGVRGITDLMVMPGLINLDFADVQTVMQDAGKAMMGTGEADGESRARLAAEAAIANPLLDEVSMRGAKGVIINITGGMDLTLYEVDEAANWVREQVDPDANIIVGSAFSEALNGKMRVSVVATGIAAANGEVVMPRPRATRNPDAAAPVHEGLGQTAVAATVADGMAMDELTDEVDGMAGAMPANALMDTEEKGDVPAILPLMQPSAAPIESQELPSFFRGAAAPELEQTGTEAFKDEGSAVQASPFVPPLPDLPELDGVQGSSGKAQPADPMDEYFNTPLAPAPVRTEPSLFGNRSSSPQFTALTPAPVPAPASVLAAAAGTGQAPQRAPVLRSAQAEAQEEMPPSKPSLFERMTSGFRAREAAPPRKPAVTTELFEPEAEQQPLRHQDIRLEPGQASAQPQARPGESLEIPSFLRRQVN